MVQIPQLSLTVTRRGWSQAHLPPRLAASLPPSLPPSLPAHLPASQLHGTTPGTSGQAPK